MTKKWKARLRWWWTVGRKQKRPKRYQANGWPIYRVMSAYEMQRLLSNQHMRLERH